MSKEEQNFDYLHDPIADNSTRSDYIEDKPPSEQQEWYNLEHPILDKRYGKTKKPRSRRV